VNFDDPGNVRELQNIVEQDLVLNREGLGNRAPLHFA